MASIATSYNTRAPTYDDKTTFHRQLASSYITYAKPQPGESLLDLACGTGLVTFEFAPLLQSNPQNVTHRASGPNASKPVIVGVDISRGMLDVARSKLQKPSNQDPEIQFVEHDITTLSSIPELRGKQDTFDIITICSALVLLPNPGEAIKQWAGYLKKGGRMIVDVPHTHSMLSLKVLDIIASELGIDILGKRTWIEGPQSLEAILRNAGLDARVLVTDVFESIPARTEEGRDEWGADEAGDIFDMVMEGGRMGEWNKLDGEERQRARRRFVEEWRKLAGDDGVVREEGRLFVGVGTKT